MNKQRRIKYKPIDLSKSLSMKPDYKTGYFTVSREQLAAFWDSAIYKHPKLGLSRDSETFNALCDLLELDKNYE